MESKAPLLAGEKYKKRSKITNSICLVFSLCLFIYRYNGYMEGLRDTG